MSFDFIEEEDEPQESVVPTLLESIKKLVESSTMELRVSMPAEVVRFDFRKQQVDVKPFFKRKHSDNTTTEPGIIYNVPVAFPRANEAFISLPLKVGDSVFLIFSDRSLEKWLGSGERDEPGDTRIHHISDAVAIPGCYPFSNSAKVNNANDIIIKNKNMEIRVKPNGHVQLMNKSGVELLRVLDDYMTADIRGNYYAKVAIQRKLRTLLER
jgi:hypothetical protein